MHLKTWERCLKERIKVFKKEKKVDVKEPYSDSEKWNNFEIDDSNDDIGDEQADFLFYTGSFVHHKNKYKWV